MERLVCLMPLKRRRKQKAQIRIQIYRKGIPWIAFDAIPEWIQADQKKRFGKKFLIEDCRDAVNRMRVISQAAWKEKRYSGVIIKYDPKTNRWASYETHDDLAILDAKGELKEGGNAAIAADITARSRARMIETIAELYPEDRPERIFNIWKANGYILFYSKKDGYNNTWAGWRAAPPSMVNDLPEIQKGNRRDQYCVLVQGIRDARHDWREPLEQSEFLQKLDERVVATGFELDVRNGESRWHALDVLRHSIWNVTKLEESKPLIAVKQTDGSHLISDRSLFFESARLSSLPKLVLNSTTDDEGDEAHYFSYEYESGELYEHDGETGPSGEQIHEMCMMPISDVKDAHARLCQILGFEWNTLHAIQTYDCSFRVNGEIDYRAMLFASHRDGKGFWRGVNYETPAEIEQNNIEEAQREAEEKAEREAEKKHQEEQRIKKIEEDRIIAEQAKARDKECRLILGLEHQYFDPIAGKFEALLVELRDRYCGNEKTILSDIQYVVKEPNSLTIFSTIREKGVLKNTAPDFYEIELPESEAELKEKAA